MGSKYQFFEFAGKWWLYYEDSDEASMIGSFESMREAKEWHFFNIYLVEEY